MKSSWELATDHLFLNVVFFLVTCVTTNFANEFTMTLTPLGRDLLRAHSARLAARNTPYA